MAHLYKEKEIIQISINFFTIYCLLIVDAYPLIIDANFAVKCIYDYNKKVKFGEIIPRKISRVRYIKSVITIQRAWRCYAARKAMRKRIARLEEVLDMTIPSWQCRRTIAKDDDNFQRRRPLISEFDARLKKTISDERTRVNFPNKIFNLSHYHESK